MQCLTITVYKRGGDLVLESQFVDLKLSSDRRLWIRRNWKKDNQHLDSGVKIPMGLSRAQKEMWLMEYRKRLIEKQGEMVARDLKDRRIPSMMMTLDDDDEEDEELDDEDDTEEEKEETR